MGSPGPPLEVTGRRASTCCCTPQPHAREQCRLLSTGCLGVSLVLSWCAHLRLLAFLVLIETLQGAAPRSRTSLRCSLSIGCVLEKQVLAHTGLRLGLRLGLCLAALGRGHASVAGLEFLVGSRMVAVCIPLYTYTQSPRGVCGIASTCTARANRRVGVCPSPRRTLRLMIRPREGRALPRYPHGSGCARTSGDRSASAPARPSKTVLAPVLVPAPSAEPPSAVVSSHAHPPVATAQRTYPHRPSAPPKLRPPTALLGFGFGFGSGSGPTSCARAVLLT